MRDNSSLPRLADLPIPTDCVADDSWPPLLREIADHVGGHAALTIADRFGGRQTRVALDVTRNPFRSVLTAEQARVFTDVFGGCCITLPTARASIARARRAAVIAAVRAGTLTGADAAVVVSTSRRYIQYLVHETTEGVGVAPIVLPEPREKVALRRAADAIGIVLSDAGIAPDLIAASKARLLGTTFLSPYLEPCGEAQ